MGNRACTAKYEIVVHHLHMFGIKRDAFALDKARRLIIHEDDAYQTSMLAVENGAIVLLHTPSVEMLAMLGVSCSLVACMHTNFFRCEISSRQKFTTLKTIHDFQVFGDSRLHPIVVTTDGQPAWGWLPCGKGGYLLIGTNLADDTIRFRQGDPAEATQRPKKALWGIAGERPNYLFEPQISDLPHGARPVDEWYELLAGVLADLVGYVRHPILPNGATGAIVVTGDDDQAQLEKYAEQLKLIGNTPITYFLHPLTRHTPDTLNRMIRKYRVDFGIHPDALAAPQQYADLLHQQCAWFQDLTKQRAKSVRNHGFLNDGYWGHLNPWLDEKIHISTNLPGLDGRALNGSLLPARVYASGHLTEHWSVVTAIGDGVRYVNGGKSDLESANCIFDLADAIRQSGIPGVMVLNLHPQNVSDTHAMHLAVLEVIRSGFVAWNMQDCLDWFADGVTRPPVGFLQRTFARVLPIRFPAKRRAVGLQFFEQGT